jgi:hypothetical protein
VIPADVEIGEVQALAEEYPDVAGEIKAISASGRPVDQSAAAPR